MRTYVTFRYPTEFDSATDAAGILAVSGVQWFVELLRRVADLQIDDVDEHCQQDWGVVLYARREDKKFWIGLSIWEGEHSWLSHFHHDSFFAWLQRLSSSGKRELQRVLCDFHAVLASEPAVSEIVWYEEKEIRKARPAGFPTPGE